MIKKYLILISSFGIMLCLGSVYAWSIVVPELKTNFNFSSSQTQTIFGVLIAIFPLTMIFAGRLEKRLGSRILAIISAIFFSAGYILSGLSGGNFLTILLGIGVLAGIGTGFGYLAALTSPVKCFPEKKGLVTGIAAAGFGLAAIIFSFITENLLKSGKDILEIFIIIGISYGIIILLFSYFIKVPTSSASTPNVVIGSLIRTSKFFKLFFGIFFGTFAGLLIVGSLKPIGAEHINNSNALLMGVSVFAIANFLGRLAWGTLSDYISTSLTIIIALTFQAVSIFLMGFLSLTDTIFIVLSAFIGFGFGGNFVLFAKETAQLYGVNNLAIIYPYVFLGYAFAGILGPLTGGVLHDYFNSYNFPIYTAAFMSFSGATIFIIKNIEANNHT